MLFFRPRSFLQGGTRKVVAQAFAATTTSSKTFSKSSTPRGSGSTTRWTRSSTVGRTRLSRSRKWSPRSSRSSCECKAPKTFPSKVTRRDCSYPRDQATVFSGITFTETRATFLEQYEVPSGGDWSVHRGAAFEITNAERITITGSNAKIAATWSAWFLSSLHASIRVSIRPGRREWSTALQPCRQFYRPTQRVLHGRRPVKPSFLALILDLILSLGTYARTKH